MSLRLSIHGKSCLATEGKTDNLLGWRGGERVFAGADEIYRISGRLGMKSKKWQGKPSNPEPHH